MFSEKKDVGKLQIDKYVLQLLTVTASYTNAGLNYLDLGCILYKLGLNSLYC